MADFPFCLITKRLFQFFFQYSRGSASRSTLTNTQRDRRGKLLVELQMTAERLCTIRAPRVYVVNHSVEINTVDALGTCNGNACVTGPLLSCISSTGAAVESVPTIFMLLLIRNPFLSYSITTAIFQNIYFRGNHVTSIELKRPA